MNNIKNKAYGKIKLVFPTEEYKNQVLDFLQEFFDNNEFEIAGDAGLDNIKDFDVWLEKIRADLTKGIKEKDKVSATLFLAIRKEDEKIVGIIQIRHTLNEYLLNFGGHIGDSVRPSERKKGYATEMIRLSLEECRKMNIERVLMTCDKENIASRKSIQNNGGVIENEVLKEGKIVQRLWIEL